MKKLHLKLSAIATCILFPLLFIFHKGKRTAYLFTFLVLVTLSSCYLNYYRTNTKPAIDATTVSKLSSESRYFIIHFRNSTNGLEQAYVKGDSLYGTIVPLPLQHSKYLYPQVNNENNRVKHIDKADALMEVHLYTNAENRLDDVMFSAPIGSFTRADIYELNKSATTTNHILSTVGIITTVALIVGTIAAIAAANAAAAVATGACNCPQVYMENNGDYSFASGLYSGAVYASLERMDYLPLNTIAPDAKNISFKIANGKNEEQFINKVELLQVNHLKGTNVLPDRHGNIIPYGVTHLPATATTNGKDDIIATLKATDNKYYSFNNAANENGFSDVILGFDKPEGTTNAKLIIHARNTYWGGLLHKEFLNLFGDNFEKWKDKQEKADPKELEKWQTDQAQPLMVYIKTKEGWKFIDYFPLIGNTASRDMIMELNTQNIPGEKIEIKLETAYRFWDIDFAGIDYSADEYFTTTVVEPEEAIKSDSTDQSTTLLNSDKTYTHLTGDDFVFFRYKVTAVPENNVPTYFLVSGGYYHSLEQITGKTNYNELYKFKKKAAFDHFSREKYKEAQDVAAIMNGIKQD